MIPIQQPWAHERAYRKGYARGLAASDPTRKIAVNLSSFSTRPDTLGIPRWISLTVEQGTPVHDVLTELHRRLGDIPYPFTISTLGANPRELELEDPSGIMDLLKSYDADALSLRLNVDLPAIDKEAKKSLGSRLRSALGAGTSRSGGPQDGHTVVLSNSAEEASSQASVRSAPPPYEEAIHSEPQVRLG